jgi:hypothetical protein
VQPTTKQRILQEVIDESHFLVDVDGDRILTALVPQPAHAQGRPSTFATPSRARAFVAFIYVMRGIGAAGAANLRRGLDADEATIEPAATRGWKLASDGGARRLRVHRRRFGVRAARGVPRPAGSLGMGWDYGRIW